eukprot:CAMPEP_0206156728 /NCGR_PEP_ID=MMETSP1474-20131121/3250_1 /ASSEMBLY_ACC=CAM_ASM_001110 /TAXON_ID=97495 /ORGANISM="Imantonia sp., Strain RCC918" /LENGTH=187 /DNA_ID=CAMNT_0053555941 /DNA_START=88 /DNA_END=652 /DNA_ORIENTATION=-
MSVPHHRAASVPALSDKELIELLKTRNEELKELKNKSESRKKNEEFENERRKMREELEKERKKSEEESRKKNEELEKERKKNEEFEKDLGYKSEEIKDLRVELLILESSKQKSKSLPFHSNIATERNRLNDQVRAMVEVKPAETNLSEKRNNRPTQTLPEPKRQRTSANYESEPQNNKKDLELLHNI